MNLRKGAKVWVEDKNLAWVAAEITDCKGKHVQVQTPSGKSVQVSSTSIYFSILIFEHFRQYLFVYFLEFFLVVQVLSLPEKLFPRDADEEEEHGGVDDMTKLTYLNEPGVLYNLERRYALNDIYVSLSLLNTGVMFKMMLNYQLNCGFFALIFFVDVQMVMIILVLHMVNLLVKYRL